MTALPVALDTTLQSVLTELQQKLETGQPVELGSASLAALESITATISGSVTVGSMPEVEVKNDAGSPLATRASDGVYGYHAGVAAGSVDVPTGAKIRRVSVIAGATVAATLTILGGDTITIPAGGGFDEQLPGDAVATVSTSEVVIGGTVQSFYVAWVV